MKPSRSGYSPELIQLGELLKSQLLTWRKRLTECPGIKIIQGIGDNAEGTETPPRKGSRKTNCQEV